MNVPPPSQISSTIIQSLPCKLLTYTSNPVILPSVTSLVLSHLINSGVPYKFGPTLSIKYFVNDVAFLLAPASGEIIIESSSFLFTYILPSTAEACFFSGSLI